MSNIQQRPYPQALRIRRGFWWAEDESEAARTMVDSESTPTAPRAGKGPYLTSEDECLLRGEPGLFLLLYSRHLLHTASATQWCSERNQTAEWRMCRESRRVGQRWWSVHVRGIRCPQEKGTGTSPSLGAEVSCQDWRDTGENAQWDGTCWPNGARFHMI